MRVAEKATRMTSRAGSNLERLSIDAVRWTAVVQLWMLISEVKCASLYC